jgi:hypothetical protein
MRWFQALQPIWPFRADDLLCRCAKGKGKGYRCTTGGADTGRPLNPTSSLRSAMAGHQEAARPAVDQRSCCTGGIKRVLVAQYIGRMVAEIEADRRPGRRWAVRRLPVAQSRAIRARPSRWGTFTSYSLQLPGARRSGSDSVLPTA